MATILGARVTRITNAYCSYQGATETQGRLIAAGGILLNTIAGFLAISVRRRIGRNGSSVLHYFVWLFALMNLFTAGGYMVSFAFLPIGDLNGVVRDLPYETAMRAVIFAVGLVLIIWVFRHAATTLVEFAGQDEDRFHRARFLTIVPYLAGGIANVAVSLLGIGHVPVGIVLMSSIGSSFGGNFPLLWISSAMRPPLNGAPAITVMIPTRSVPWTIAGGIFLGLYVVLGRGISF